ncbi:MAG: hypothetical protein BHW39_07990 [Firmicutes bacterium CAG:552_39_19]|nr:MAG: hypothetical protein BHW39_07990 [Firmicutes bacterium CAG:552_39_19]
MTRGSQYRRAFFTAEVGSTLLTKVFVILRCAPWRSAKQQVAGSNPAGSSKIADRHFDFGSGNKILLLRIIIA